MIRKPDAAENRKTKVAYLRMIDSLLTGVEDYVPFALKREFAMLIDDVRYSDPMSAPELTGMEEQIEANTVVLCEMIRRGETDNLADQIKRLRAAVQERAERTRLLK